MDILQLSRDYLNQLIDYESRKLVGKIMKRHETCNNNSELKRETKELVYEGFRDFRDLIESYQKGSEIVEFKFNKRDNTSDSK